MHLVCYRGHIQSDKDASWIIGILPNRVVDIHAITYKGFEWDLIKQGYGNIIDSALLPLIPIYYFYFSMPFPIPLVKFHYGA